MTRREARTGGGNVAGACAIPAVLLALAFLQGGYHPQTWGRLTVCLGCAAAAAFWFRGDTRPTRAQLLVLAALAAFAGLMALSTFWSGSPSQSVEEARRAVLYLAGMSALVLAFRRRDQRILVLTLAAALSAIVSVATLRELLVGQSGHDDSLLVWPVGYANAVGILAAIAMLLLLAAAAFEAGWIRSVSFAGLVVLPVGLFLTSSRGGWLALTCGLLVLCTLEPRRARVLATLAATAVPAAVGIRLASGWIVVALAVLAAAVGPGLADRLEGSVVPRLALVGSVAAVAAVIVMSPTNPFGEQRTSYWSVAWHDYQAHPLLGSGAGTFARAWHEERPLPVGVKDAHSLYLETLAELGPFGVLLVVTALGTPLVAAYRRSGGPLPAGAAAAYTAFLVHVGIDWDWEMPIVTLAGLACGAALLLGGRATVGAACASGSHPCWRWPSWRPAVAPVSLRPSRPSRPRSA